MRGEYPLARRAGAGRHRRRRARPGCSGDSVMGSGFAFDLEIRRGAGAYICGEETALFNSLEGKRGEPRSKPPFPAQVGLFGKPTVVNNVETLVNVLDIVLEGGAAWARIGTQGSTGTRLFCLSGHVAAAGPVRSALRHRRWRELLTMAGGVASGRSLQAILLGGAAGTFVGPRRAVDAPHLRGRRAPPAPRSGSGVVMVFDDTADLRDTLLASPSSWQTNRAASACRAAWAPCARWSCCNAHPARSEPVRGSDGHAGSLCLPSSARPCATRRSAASVRPHRRRSNRPSRGCTCSAHGR